jgi:hypothetical protein
MNLPRRSGTDPAAAFGMSRLANLLLSRRTAYRLLLAIGFPLVFALALWLTPYHVVSHKTRKPVEGDLGLFKAVVNGQRLGRPYYEVYGDESRARGYPTQSVFNWRQPLLMRTLALLTPRISLVLLIALAGALVVQAHALLRRELLWVLTVLNAAAVAIIPGEVYFTEAWAGLCLGLSAMAYIRRRETTGASWALLALFIRELAAPYCVIAAVIALSQKRWREVGVWIGGALLYAMYFGAHVWQVSQHVLPGDTAHGHSWLYGGGLPFVLKVWQINGTLMAAPVAVFAVVVVAGVAAWWAPTMPLHVRASVVVYSVLFLFIGLPLNTYWGELIAPLVALWLAYSPEGLSRIWRNAHLTTAHGPIFRYKEQLRSACGIAAS